MTPASNTSTAGAPTAPASPPELSVTTDGSAIRIRPLHSHHEFQDCVNLQRDIWGLEQSEIVPTTLLHVVDQVGGVAVGAFDADDALLGFVFGLTGVRDGELVHWSHMLGVREATRNHGVGRMLKEYQRDAMHALGVRRIFWSFDPLQSKNAHFNINRLRAAVDSYVPDMYGKTGSPLHLGMATDRLVARIDTTLRTDPVPRIPSDRGLPILTPFPRREDLIFTVGERTPEIVLIEIPENIMEVLETSPGTAQVWRSAVRDHFQWALSKGYIVTSVYRNTTTGRSFYALSR
jgi:predicted GNAT superfamily acetyltransferase